MDTIIKYKLVKLDFPVFNYNYQVKTWVSIDGGKNFYYCGDSKYFKTLKDAETYKNEMEE